MSSSYSERLVTITTRATRDKEAVISGVRLLFELVGAGLHESRQHAAEEIRRQTQVLDTLQFAGELVGRESEQHLRGKVTVDVHALAFRIHTGLLDVLDAAGLGTGLDIGALGLGLGRDACRSPLLVGTVAIVLTVLLDQSRLTARRSIRFWSSFS